ncbi:hypothetical protein KP509_06G070900 [Ceratopteris richardii]|uniref:Uncharacterized protein n=1 Tax=Ceratopteris richardii TaxID=49495 RepID=A0A8T2UHJ9_CERRI|nr:hypothetical protein KP509_06G070900 [Ceratopteris richardii]
MNVLALSSCASCSSSLGGSTSICFQLSQLPNFQRHVVSLVGRRTGCLRVRVSSSAAVEDPWLEKLPDKKKPLYSHSLPCIEAWLRSLGFVQNNDDRASWTIQRADWHARLSLDMTDLFIRYLKSGPGNLERDVERKFSYALSREDLENAILGGP